PRQADHADRWFEIHTELVAACGPLLRLTYPDGEVAEVGDDDAGWQALLTRRAEGEPDAGPGGDAAGPDDAAAGPDDAAGPGAAAAGPPASGAPPPGAAPAAPPPRGRWQRVQTESWPGQLEFLRQRPNRCAESRTWRSVYTTGHDESGRLTVWAEVPQELERARLTVRVYEIVDEEAEEEERERAARAERRRRERAAAAAEAAARPI